MIIPDTVEVTKDNIIETIGNLCYNYNIIGFSVTKVKQEFLVFDLDNREKKFIHIKGVNSLPVCYSGEINNMVRPIVQENVKQIMTILFKDYEILEKEIYNRLKNIVCNKSTDFNTTIDRIKKLFMSRYGRIYGFTDSVDDCIVNIRGPKFSKSIENKSKYFDFIEVEVLVSSHGEDRKKFLEFLKSHKKEIDKRVVSKIKYSKKWIDSKIPINFLKCTDCVLVNGCSLNYMFVIKEIQ